MPAPGRCMRVLTPGSIYPPGPSIPSILEGCVECKCSEWVWLFSLLFITFILY